MSRDVTASHAIPGIYAHRILLIQVADEHLVVELLWFAVEMGDVDDRAAVHIPRLVVPSAEGDIEIVQFA